MPSTSGVKGIKRKPEAAGSTIRQLQFQLPALDTWLPIEQRPGHLAHHTTAQPGMDQNLSNP